MKDKQLFIVFKLLEKDQMSVANTELVKNSYITIGPVLYIQVDLLRRSQLE